MPGAIASQFGRLVRSVNNVPPLHLLAGIGAVVVALTLVTPFAFEASGDNAFIALTIAVGLLTMVATRLAERAPRARTMAHLWTCRRSESLCAALRSASVQ